MDRTEFLSRWEALPALKCAELIEGVVFVPSPVTLDHGERDSSIIWWLGHYSIATPGCEVGNNTTWWMLSDAPQPDVHLRIRPECGGQSSVSSDPRYLTGAPELAVEVCLTSTEVDFGPKLKLYQRAGVKEYISIVLLPPRRIVWRILRDSGWRVPIGYVSGLVAGRRGVLEQRRSADACDCPTGLGISRTPGIRGPAAPVNCPFQQGPSGSRND
jgi:hypothetical protein